MRSTKDKVFADSNVLLYLLGKDACKKAIAKEILHNKTVISTQVINENISVCTLKFKLPVETTEKHTENLINNCIVKYIKLSTIYTAIKVFNRYKYRYYDSLIIASALENNCNILYSEDMQHNQKISLLKNKLTIINPFI